MADEKETANRTTREKPPKKYKKYLWWIIPVVICAAIAFRDFIFQDVHRLTQAELLQKARAGQVAEVQYDEDDPRLVVVLKGDTHKWEVIYPTALAEDTFKVLSDTGVLLKPEKTRSVWGAAKSFVILLLWLALIWSLIPLLKRGLDKLRGKEPVQGTRPKKQLSDVKGMPEVVEELSNFANILKDPERAKKLGARLPAGVVLYGEPGTGKTLLAEAFAGEVGVPFFKVKGSDVRTKWVGDAARAIKAYFDRARKHKVSVMLFDEGDTIGGRRSESDSGGHDEHRSLVNEILTQMNPDQPGGHVFVIIVTNHPGMLDTALTRSGRIDLELAVLPPDIKGREAILEIHTKGKQLAPGVDLAKLAKETYGFTGADIEALVNNAALQAVKRDAESIGVPDFDKALVIMRAGPAITSKYVSGEDKRVTAYHEAGHGLLAAVLDRIPNPTGITILQHGQSGGHTLATPDEAKQSQYTSRRTAFQELVMLMGGLAGEKLAMDGDFTNGTADDRRVATQKAGEMVGRWGMGTYNTDFGRDWRTGPHADEVLAQIEGLLDEAETQALSLLLQYKREFDALVTRLLEEETLRAEDLATYQPRPESPEHFEELKAKHQKLFDGIKRSPAPDSITNGRRKVAVG